MRMQKLTLAAAIASISIATPANALNIILFNNGFALGSEARKSLEVAASYWESVLTDDFRMNLTIQSNALRGNLGVTDSVSIDANVESLYHALANDGTSSLDAQAVANLQPLVTSADGETRALTVIANGLNSSRTLYVDETTRTDNDGSRNNTVIELNYANAEALGYGSQLDDTLSYGNMVFSNLVKFDYDPTDGIDQGSYDFTGIAIREIGVSLGLYSGVTTYDFYTSPKGTNQGLVNALENSSTARTVDLFRYSEAGELDWSTSSEEKYFSIDGGETQLFGSSSYGKGVRNGDGNYAYYWNDNASGESVGIMDGSVGTGTTMGVSALDLASLDAIGWDLNIDVLANSDYRMSTADIYRAMTAVPEPSTWLQMLLGFGLIGGAVRYRRPRTTVSFA